MSSQLQLLREDGMAILKLHLNVQLLPLYTVKVQMQT